jgi:hypothetical protein
MGTLPFQEEGVDSVIQMPTGRWWCSLGCIFLENLCASLYVIEPTEVTPTRVPFFHTQRNSV